MNDIEYAWMQVSDLHVFENTEWNILKEAYKKLPYQEEIRFLVVTGDLHQYKDDYIKTEKFLGNLLELYNLSKKDIFIVPGNHDSEECDAKEAITHYIENMVEQEQECYRKYFVKGKLIDCFKRYNAFIDSFYGDLKKDIYPEPEQVNCIIWNNKLNIIHLNSAINCNGNNKLHQIIDIYKLSNFYEKIDKSVPTIMIAHHPFEKIHTSHQDTLRRFITDWNISAYLCGDAHKQFYYPIQTYKSSDSNIPCIVCAKAAPEQGDYFSDLGCIIYTKSKRKDEVQVNPFSWNLKKKSFEPYNGMNNDAGPLKFGLMCSKINKGGQVIGVEKKFEPLPKGESIWLPDAEYATGEQARFSAFTTTEIINNFISSDSNIWGLSAVKGIGKTFVLQVKRRKISKYEKQKLCLPIGTKLSAANSWGMDTIQINGKTDLALLKKFENNVLLWKYCIIVYAINQLINIANNSENREDFRECNPGEQLHKRISERFKEKKISYETYILCTSDEYNKLALIMQGVLSYKNWINFVDNDLSILILMQRRIEDVLKVLGKESIAILIDKIDQAVAQTNAESPVDCEVCKKSEKIRICDNPNKGSEYCFNNEIPCRNSCCFGCEKYETPYSNTNLRVYGNAVKKYEHINIWQYLQMGLLKAVSMIKQEFGGIIEVYYTIRQEAFSCEKALLGEHAVKIKGLTKELWYTKEQQQKIFYECIEHQQDEYLFEPALKNQKGRLEEAFVGVTQLCHPYAKNLTESVFESIYRHSFDRTRDLQEYGQMLTEHMDEIRACDTVLERGEKVKMFIEEHAAKLAFCESTERAEEKNYYAEKLNLLPNYWADSQNFKKFIKMIDKNLFFGDEAKKMCKRFNQIERCKKDCSECKAQHHPFSMLYKLGMLGQIKTYRRWTKVAEQQFIHSKDITYITETQLINLNKDTIYVLHPALTKSIEHMNQKVRHFSGFIIGKGIEVPQDKLEELESDYKLLGKRSYETKYFYDKK